MSTLFTNARLIDPEMGREVTGALLVTDGAIAAILPEGAAPPPAAQTIDCNGRVLAPGIVDIGVKIGEPAERKLSLWRSPGSPILTPISTMPGASTLPSQSMVCAALGSLSPSGNIAAIAPSVTSSAPVISRPCSGSIRRALVKRVLLIYCCPGPGGTSGTLHGHWEFFQSRSLRYNNRHSGCACVGAQK